MSIPVDLSREAIEELIAGGIEKYESRRGESHHSGHPDLGAVLQDHLTRNSVSRTNLAEQSAITTNYVTKIILGERTPTAKVLGRFHRVLGDDFLLEWFGVIEHLDDASQGIGKLAYLKSGPWVITRDKFEDMVRRCRKANKLAYGTEGDARCRREMDSLVREQPGRYGERHEHA